MDAQVEIALAVAVAEEVTQAVTSVETQDVTVMVQQAVAVDLTSLLDQRYHQELLLEEEPDDEGKSGQTSSQTSVPAASVSSVVHH